MCRQVFFYLRFSFPFSLLPDFARQRLWHQEQRVGGVDERNQHADGEDHQDVWRRPLQKDAAKRRASSDTDEENSLKGAEGVGPRPVGCDVRDVCVHSCCDGGEASCKTLHNGPKNEDVVSAEGD